MTASRRVPVDPSEAERVELARASLPEIARRVRERYHPDPPVGRRDPEPLDGLVETILSQQNTAPITRRQFAALKGAFPEWPDALFAGPKAIEDVLRGAGGGLARVKAEYIWRILDDLAAHGDVTLASLHGLDDAEVRARLEALPGVGPKTASCVMMFDMLRPAMPVDTHIHRISRRLWLVPDRWSAPRTEAWYDAVLPRRWTDRYAYHVAMIRHGRETCVAQRPRCGRCVLRDLCPSAELFVLATGAPGA